MSDGKIPLEELVIESLRLRQTGTEKYIETFFEGKTLSEQISFLDELIKDLQQKRENLNKKLGEKHTLFENELKNINANIAKNRTLIESSSLKKTTTSIDKQSAIMVMDSINRSPQENLRLTGDEKKRLLEIMEKLKPFISADMKGEVDVKFPYDLTSCTRCSASCKGSCTGDCSGSCTYSCEASCAGNCETACYISCKGSCTGDCSTGCYNSCE